jgi:predicted CoA-binding protein
MTHPDAVLAAAGTFLVVDWPSRDVPDALARGGYGVVVHGGPGPGDYTAYEMVDGVVVARHVGRPPEHADVVYSFRPFDELPEIVDAALAVGAEAVWVQSGLDLAGEKDPTGCWLAPEAAAGAREVVESAGLVYLDHPYIADAVRRRS